MKHYLFTDDVTGEDFIVGEYDFEAAYRIARYEFERPIFICELTEEEAEASGLDEY